jgi:CHASE3 domain sensor protein
MSRAEFFLDKVLAIIGGISAFGTLILSYFNLQKLKDVHIQINSRMDQLLEKAGLLGKAEGREEERTKEKPPVDNSPT